jgi:uncharacterized protein (DUF1015 family)
MAMPDIRPFAGIRYARRSDLELSKLIAPPYDVLDDAQKAALQARHANNIVTIDLPFTPPKSVGPDEVYARANTTLRAWLSAGILVQDRRPAIYPYTQTFTHHGKVFHRRGFIALVKLSPFGEGHVVPHEKTYTGPIEDRLKLMDATGVQLSPIFGLFNDTRGEITHLLYQNLGRPDADATENQVRNQLWSVIDSDVENEVIKQMGTKPVFIADGHHRYTTALAYQKQIAERNGGSLPVSHPANWCMFVLVSAQDDGLLILPTHRLIGGLSAFSAAAFRDAIMADFEMTEVPVTPAQLPDVAANIAAGSPHTFGLYDAKGKATYILTLKNENVLQRLAPERSDAWRRLDVAILHRYLIEEILKPKFAGGKDPALGYTADAATIGSQVDGEKFQIALLLRPTPLPALDELGKNNEVMPQKSTYFFPKLATGMVLNPLEPTN